MNINDTYEEFYRRGNSSKVFSTYCAEVFGIDLSQDGFSDKEQLDFLIEYAEIDKDDICLDIGCGNGKIDDYISKKTRATIYGIDYSPSAIKNAKKIEKANDHVKFVVGDINHLEIPKDHYSRILLIDSIYFSDDYSKTLHCLYRSLKSPGKLCIFYSEFVFEEDKQVKKIEKDETKIAVIIKENDWPSKSVDFTDAHYELMKRKNNISDKYKNGFEEENNRWLYEKVQAESVSTTMPKEDFMRFTNRYLYCITKD